MLLRSTTLDNISVRMPFECAEQRPIGDCPQLDGLVPAGAGEHVPLRIERDTVDIPSVPFERCELSYPWRQLARGVIQPSRLLLQSFLGHAIQGVQARCRGDDILGGNCWQGAGILNRARDIGDVR